ncbi:hypothetical protein ACA910_022368 [Epithemia clementina (nom. ined.)]
MNNSPPKLVIVYFPSLFCGQSDKLPQKHPSLPSHHHSKIVAGIGSENDKLYQSKHFTIAEINGIVQIAFVFGYGDLGLSQNRWSHGTKMFFVWFEEVDLENGGTKLVPMQNHVKLFIYHSNFAIDMLMPFAPQCYAHVAWKGLF